MAAINDYHLVAGRTAEELREEVKKLLDLGWQPFGSPFTSTVADEINATMYQAMVKYERSINTITDV
jgi:hypothetical protein